MMITPNITEKNSNKESPDGAMANLPGVAIVLYLIEIKLRKARQPLNTPVIIQKEDFVYPIEFNRLTSCDLILSITIDD